eukprot:2361150-Pyramimonas_sp.AAC.1
MSCPPPCTTEPSHICDGDILHGLLTADDIPLHFCGDGSGGAMSADRRYRRCGWGWACMDQTTVRATMRGPLPGPRQTNNRAEMWALPSVLQNPQGPIIYWTDSE